MKFGDTDLKFIGMAIRLSEQSTRGGVGGTKPAGGPFGAVIARDGRVVGRGYNRVLGDNDPTAHGEVMAIRDACKNLSTHDLSGCVLYTSCRPCPMCLAAARWANIEKIFYAAGSDDAEKVGFRDKVMYKSCGRQNAGVKIRSAAPAAVAVMENWRKKFRKAIY